MERPTVTAKLKNLPMSAQKVRLVADVVRGKKVNEALNTLRFLNKKAAVPVAKLIMSAAANAEENKKWDTNDLVVSKIMVGDGITRRWRRFVSRGRMRTLLRRYCNIDVEVQQKASMQVSAPKKAVNKTAVEKVKAAPARKDVKKIKTTKPKITKAKKA